MKLAKKVKACLKDINKPLRIAVMGCVVNGPGEAADADLSICAGKGKGFLYKKGKKIKTIPEIKLLETLTKELKKL